MRSILSVVVMAVLIVRTGFFVSSTYAAAGINQTINFQGKLVDNTGLNVADGNYDIIFYLYAASSGGSPLWTETWNSGTSQVTTTDGVFRVALGTHSTFSAFNFNDDSLYLAIKVGADAEMTPRIRFTSVPYAFVAKTVVDDALDFAQFQDILDLDADLTVNQTAYTWNQTYTGTSAPGLSYTSSGAVTSGNAAALDINASNASTTVPAMMLTNAGSGFALRINDDGTTTDSTPLVVDANGNVGVGTTTPVGKLTVRNSQESSLTPFIQFVPTGTVGISTLSYYGGGSAKAGELSAIGDYDSSAAPYHLYYSASNGANPALVDAWQTAKTSVTQTTADIYFDRGSVGIGTTAPVGKLDVTDNSNTAASLSLTNNTATTIGNAGNTLGVLDLQSTSLTTGNFLNMEVNALTTGTALNISRSGAGLTTGGELVNLDMGAAVAGNGANITTTGVYTGTGLLTLTANSATTGSLAALSGTGLTTGTGLSITTNTALQAAGELLDLNMGAATTGSAATLRTTGVFTNTAGLLNITANAATTGSLAALSGTGLTSGTGLSITGGAAMATNGELLYLNMGAAVAGNGASIVTTGVYTGTGLLTLTANSATTGDIMNLSATGLTTGSALVMTGPSSTGVTDHFLKITSDVGSASSLIYGAPDFSGNTVTGYGLNITATDSTATANTDYANYNLLTLTGNAAKSGYGTYGRVTTASTTADTTYGGYFSTATTGAVTTGTQNTYGLYGATTSANVAGGTVNAYGGYFKSGGTVASGTINSYGLYIANGTMNTTGTANNFGLYVEAPTGADTNVAGYFGGNVGIGTTAPVSLLSVGTGSPFQVDTNGDIIKLKNLTYAWPAAHVTDGFLKNNGSGTLTWTTITGAGGVTGSGTDNYIPRWNGTTALENSNIFDDGTNVGIGTTSPATKLHSVGRIRIDQASTYNGEGGGIAIRDSVDTNRLLYIGYDAALEASYIQSIKQGTSVKSLLLNAMGGNVGIGTTAPTQALHVVGSARITGALYDSSNSAGSSTNILTSTGTGTAWTTVSSALDTTYFKQNGNSFTGLATLGTNDAYGLAFETSGTEWMRILTDGKVGIGTTSPSEKLELNGNLLINTNNPTFVIRDNSGAIIPRIAFQGTDTTERAAWYISGTDVNLYAQAGYDLALGANATEVVRIKNGNVGIGTTAPTQELHVVGDARVTGGYYDSSNAIGSSGYYLQSNGSGTAWTDLSTSLLPAGTEGQMLYNNAGTWTAHSGTFWDDTNSRLGIGTTTPTSKLHIIGSVANPTPLAEVYDGDGEFNRLTSGAGVTVVGNYAYTTSNFTDNALSIIDISDPTNPQLMSEVYDGDGEFSKLAGAYGVEVSGKYAYIASQGDDSVTIMDISDPTDPVLMSEVYDADGEFSRLNGAIRLHLSGQYLYVVSEVDDSVTIMDISDPTDPVLMSEVYDADGEFNRLNGALDIYVKGSYAYVASLNDNSLTIMDISDPTDPVLMSEVYDADGEFNRLGQALGVTVSGKYAYISSYATADKSITIADISDPTNPQLVSEVYDGDGEFNRLYGVRTAIVSGDYLFVVASVDNGLTIMDISNPANPQLVSENYDGNGTFNRLNFPVAIDVVGDRAYIVSAIDNGFTVVNIGGTKTNTLLAGSAVLSTLQVQNKSYFNNDVSILGSLTSKDAYFYGDVGIYNTGAQTALSIKQDGTGDILNLFDGSTEVFTVLDGGNVGIGTTAPTQELHVVGDARITGALYDSSNSAGSSTNILTSTGTGTAWSSLSSALDTSYFKQNGNSFTGLATLGTNDAYDLAFETSGTEWMRILTDGKVGIGTTSPSVPLEVRGDIKFGGVGSNKVGTLTSNTTQVTLRAPAGTHLGLGANGGNSDIFINSSGNVGIGTTSPSSPLEVAGEIELANYLYFGNGSSEYLRWDSSDFLLSDDLLPNANDALDLGSDTARWRDLYLGGETLHLGASTTDEGTISYTSGNVLSFGTDSTTNGDIAFFTDDLYLDKSAGFVGIGTTSPGAALHVVGNITSPGTDANSEKFGYGASANNNSVALGRSATATGATGTVAIGYTASATGQQSTAIGYSSSATGIRGLAFGYDVTNTGNDSMVIGNSASVGHNAVVIGQSASTTSSYAVLLGRSTSVTGVGGIAIGEAAVSAANGIALGQSANATANTLVAGSSSYPINALYFGKGITDATPTTLTLNGTGGSGTNIVGGDLSIAAGKATGNAVGGSILFQTSDAGGSGSTLQSLTTKMTILAGGNVGIGTTAPSITFEVAGGIAATGVKGFISSPYQIVAPRGLVGQGTGALTSVGTTATGTNPYNVAVDPTGRFAYVANYSSTTVQAYTIDQSSGALTSVGTTATGTSPYGVAVDPTGRFVYVANYGSTTVQAYTINQSTGALTSVGTTATGSGPWFVTVDPTGRFTYVTNRSSNTIQAYTINQSTGALTSVGTTATGSSPYSVAVDPTGRFAYVANNGSTTVQAYTIDQSTGALTSVGTTATGSSPRSVAVDSSGRFAYVANGTATTVQAYTIDQTTGALTSVGTTATGTNPYNVTVDPTGRYAYVANYGSTTVQAYTINQTTGALTSVGTTATGTNPWNVAVDPTGRFAYVTNVTSPAVQAYTLNNLSAGSAYFAGNVGIGTTAPTNSLTVASANTSIVGVTSGTAKAGVYGSSGTGAAYGLYGINNNAVGVGVLAQQDSTGYALYSTGGKNYFSGNVGIGTTAPAYSLDVKASGTNIARFIGSNSTGCTLSDGGVIACSSDRNLKKNIVDGTLGLDALMQLRPVTFNWNSQAAGESKYLGFIAQEVEQVAPELVTIDSNGYRQLNSIGIIPIVAKAVQEQQGLINTLQANVQVPDAKIATVSSKLETLNTKVSGWDGLFISIQSIIQTIQETFVTLQNQLGLVRNDITQTQQQVASLSASLTTLTSWKEAISSGELPSTTGAVLGATDSAVLGNVATASSLLVKNNLQVEGKTTAFDLTVLNKLTSGVIEIGAGIDGDEINASTGIRFQTLAQGPVDFMNGKVIIDVDGSISAKHFKLDTLDATSSTGGKGVMPAGEVLTTVYTSSITPDSMVFITVQGDYAPATRYWVTNHAPGESFMVQFDRPTTGPVEFSWFIIN